MNIKKIKTEEIKFLHDVSEMDATKLSVNSSTGELEYLKLDGNTIVISDMTDETYGSYIYTSAQTYAVAQDVTRFNSAVTYTTGFATAADVVIKAAAITSASTFATAADATHVHSSTAAQVIFNSGGTALKGNANMTFNADTQVLTVGKVCLSTGVVSSFQMKAADGTATVYNVYISGGTMTIAAV